MLADLGLSHGNLAGMARSDIDDWRRDAARGLLGIQAPSCEKLQWAGSPQARFALASASWISGDIAAAVEVLKTLPGHPPARRLAALIAKPTIDVLSFLPQDRMPPHQLAAAGETDGRFRLRNVSFAPGDVANRPDADVAEFYADGLPPDFVVAEMVEWQLLPRNLRACPAPLIGHTSDLDLHIQSVLPWLDQFDALLTVGDSEWVKLSRLAGPERCLVYPPVFSVEPTPLKMAQARPIDFVLTQTVFSPSHRDKEAVLKRILDVPDLDYVLHNGNMPIEAFRHLLQTSKLTLSFIRHPESMPTRAMEALAAGCCCLVPRSSTLSLYVPPDHGLVPVDFDDTAALRRAILAVTRDEVERYEAAALRGAALMRSRFGSVPVGDRYLRFLTVLAAVIGPAPDRHSRAEPALQKTHACWLGPMPDKGRPETMAALRASNLRLGAALPIERRLNEAGREAILNYELVARRQRPAASPALAVDAVTAFRAALDAAPDALAPTFNFIRAAFHFGNETIKLEAARLAEAVVARPREVWQLGFCDDLLTYDFYPTHAPTRRFSELLIDLASGEAGARTALIDAILSAIHFYLGWRHESAEPFRRACRLLPDFVEARLQLARALVETGDPAAAIEALEHLRWLDERYVVAAELPHLIRRAQRLAGQAESPSLPHAGLRLIDNLGDYFADFSTIAASSRYRFSDVGRVVWRRSGSGVATSLILLDRHQCWRSSIEALASDLRDKSTGVEIVYIDLFAKTDERMLAFADVVVRDHWPVGIVEHAGRAFADAFFETRSDVLIFAERLDGVDAVRLGAAVDAVRARPSDCIVTWAWPEPNMSTPWPQVVIVARELFLALGGFDLSVACQGPRGGVRELVWRARNYGADLLDPSLSSCAWAKDWSLDADGFERIAQFIAISGKPNWSDRLRIAPIYSHPRMKTPSLAVPEF